VFRERRVSLAQLVAAMDNDFEGEDLLRSRLLNKVPKYGEGAGGGEHYAALVARLYCEIVREHVNPRGGPYVPGFWSMTTHVGFGRRLGALPSGRKSGRPLSDGISPVNGADRRGPTASLLAAAAVGGEHVGNGLALNEKLDPGFVAGEAGTRLMAGLTRGYFDAGGMQVQYNIIDPEVLIDAKKHPERHRDLVVRISGYSAYFNDLTEEMKDDIIARTLHGATTAAGPACRG
jgi:formate C-acetyltransferase